MKYAFIQGRTQQHTTSRTARQPSRPHLVLGKVQQPQVWRRRARQLCRQHLHAVVSNVIGGEIQNCACNTRPRLIITHLRAMHVRLSKGVVLATALYPATPRTRTASDGGSVAGVGQGSVAGGGGSGKRGRGESGKCGRGESGKERNTSAAYQHRPTCCLCKVF
eukprot:364542-Chlamydomonas_euryale.AAC.11